MTNLGLCFPDWTMAERRQVTKDHFVFYARAFFDRFEVWRADEQAVRRMVLVREAHHFEAVKDRPTIVLAPHFLGLDAGGIRLQLDCQMVSMYSNQSSDVLNNFVLAGRSRVNGPAFCPTWISGPAPRSLRRFLTSQRPRSPVWFVWLS